MTKRMLIDASHAEETRVVVLDGNRLEDFDVETSAKRQLKGNIYLAKVVRVEPSLQAAFVEYGGNRHGFLAFSEIHPDYYQIPVADRQRLLEMEAEEARREEEEADLEIALDHAQAEAPVHDAPEDNAPGDNAPRDNAPEDNAPGDDAPARDAPVQFERDPTAPAHAGPAQDAAEHGASGHGVGDAASGVAAPNQHAGSGEHEPGRSSESLSDARTNDAGSDSDPAGANAPGEHGRLNGSLGAQPLAIEPDSLSGPVESATRADPGTGQFTDEAASQGAQPASPDTTEAHTDRSKQLAQLPEAAALFNGSSQDDESGLQRGTEARHPDADGDARDEDDDDTDLNEPAPETVGGDNDGGEERSERRLPPRFLRNYKIQEVIRRRQILLVQVVKEERGTKGAALTTYISLAGRFSVLMPNSPRGGGISRKITSATDRRRLKEVMTELAIPRGMGLIVRTAGANRPKPEIKRDCEYLLRLWDDIRDHTMNSVAPALIYEEASLIKRAIRDVYSRDVDDIMVDGEEGWRAAHDFMRMLMPTHAKKVQMWRDTMPLFARYQVEAQLDSMLLPTVQLRSGGYLVINQAEALVAIDVNSGRSTRERGIEETALRTNLEAADEVARQLRLRDLAGLIVIDFIDMEHRRHNAMVERRLKEALKNDRARIQLGQISHFGLLEMSRQRLRPSLAETSFVGCPHCGGTGHVRSTESAAIHVLRGIEDEGGKRRAAEIVVHVATPIALYLLNHKRERLREIEQRYAMRVIIAADDSQFASQYRVERVRPQITAEALPVITPDVPQMTAPAASAVAEDEPDQDEDGDEEDDDAVDARAEDGAPEGTPETAEEAEHRRRRRRRRRRGRRDDAPGSVAGVEGSDSSLADGAGSGEFVSQVAAGMASAERAVTPEVAGLGGGPDVAGFGAPGVGAADTGGLEAGAAGASGGASGDMGPGTGDSGGEALASGAPAVNEAGPDAAGEIIEGVPEPIDAAGNDDDPRNRRRGRRGGRRRRREIGDDLTPLAEPGAEQPEVPHYSGPTPANPFGGQAFDIFDVLEQAERGVPTTRERAARGPSSPLTPVGPEASMLSAADPAPALEPSRADMMASAAQTPLGQAPVGEPAGTPGGSGAEVVTSTVDVETVIQAADAPSGAGGGDLVHASDMAPADVDGTEDAGIAMAGGRVLQGDQAEDTAPSVHAAGDAGQSQGASEEAAGYRASTSAEPPSDEGARSLADAQSGDDDHRGQASSAGPIANQSAPEPALTQPLEGLQSSDASAASVAVTPRSDTGPGLPDTADVSLTVHPVPEEDTPPAPANDAAAQAEPAVKPILIGGADTPTVEKKRGWWRR